MRVTIACLIGMVGVAHVLVQQSKDKDEKASVRYGIQADLEKYPQTRPQETLADVVKVIKEKKIGYLLAQLADPAWVDKQVKQVHGGKFEELVKETTDHLAADPTAVEELRRFLRQGQWDVGGDQASARLKGVKDRIYFRRVEDRWYFENKK